MQITEIKRIGKTQRYRLFVDGSFFATVIDETIVKNSLRTNIEYNLDELNKIVFDAQKKVALDTAMNLLSKFSKTEKELKKYLFDKGFLPDAIQYTTEKLKEYNYLSDDIYAKNYINCKINSKGKKAIFYELKMKGIDEGIIRNNLDILEKSSGEVLEKLANKFLKNKRQDEKIKEKLFRHLVSKGFEFEEINQTIRKVLNDKNGD